MRAAWGGANPGFWKMPGVFLSWYVAARRLSKSKALSNTTEENVKTFAARFLQQRRNSDSDSDLVY